MITSTIFTNIEINIEINKSKKASKAFTLCLTLCVCNSENGNHFYENYLYEFGRFFYELVMPFKMTQ